MFSVVMRVLNKSLKKRPVATNVSVYAGFYSCAEFTQQTFNKYLTPEKPDYNLPAAVRIVAVGSTVYPPILYFWYKLLDGKFPSKGMKHVITKVACDQFIMTPTLMAIFYTSLSILERKEDIFEELRQKYVKTFLANQSFWIPGQTINFAFVPPHLRIVYISCLSFIWINVLCYIKRQKLKPVHKEPKQK